MRSVTTLLIVVCSLAAAPRGVESLVPPGASQTSDARRALLRNVAVTASGLLSVGGGIIALPPPASASLLDEFGSDPTKIQQQSSTSSTSKGPAVITSKPESVYEPNLRSNYYYPTNKKRYLPRIKKCNDALSSVADSIGAEDWVAVQSFASTTADDTILPLKLYTSSLTGGGTNVKVTYTKTMFADADRFEKGQQLLLKAVAKRDQNLASTALETMAVALQEYRVTANLTGPDGGGDIPSVEDIRRAASRSGAGRTFGEKVLARDARLKGGEPPQSN
jgi:hypothetical protein